MNARAIRSDWSRLRALAKGTWGELTDDDLDRVAGKRLSLIGKLQERYGKDLATAESEVNAWLATADRRTARG